MSKKYNYHLIANLNMTIRVERFKLIKTVNESPIEMQDIPYLSPKLDISDMEDFLENANAIADNITLYYPKNNQNKLLENNLLNQVRPIIANAIKTLIDNIENESFQKLHITTIHEKKLNNPVGGLDVYIHTDINDTHKTKIYITHMPNIFSSTLIYPNRPGAIVNNFTEMTY